MRIALLGAGAGGCALACELVLAGHDVHLWGRAGSTLAPFTPQGIGYAGVLGVGWARPALMTCDLVRVCAGAEAIIVTLPTTAHRSVAVGLRGIIRSSVPIILHPGHTGGALEMATILGASAPSIVEFSTLGYVARMTAPDVVMVHSKAVRVWAAALGRRGDRALDLAQALIPSVVPCPDVLASSLSNANLVLHPPGAILAAAWVEHCAGNFTFYRDAMTPGVGRVLGALDDERRLVAAAFGHDLPTIVEEMARIGTVDEVPPPGIPPDIPIANGHANALILAPDSLDHRYYQEDFGFGLVPFLALAAVAGVEAPVASALLEIGTRLTGREFMKIGRNADAMGIAGLTRDQLLERVRAA